VIKVKLGIKQHVTGLRYGGVLNVTAIDEGGGTAIRPVLQRLGNANRF